MHETKMPRTGGEILVDQLLIQGIEQGFYVLGDAHDPLLAPLESANIELITAWQTSTALIMAEAYGKLSSHPGIAFVMSEAIAQDAIDGIHIAMQAATAMIILVKSAALAEGQAVLSTLQCQVKWSAIIEDAAGIPKIIGRAFHQAVTGRSGPVVIAITHDALTECISIADGIAITPVTIAPSMNDLAQFEQMLNFARNPILILGGSQWQAQSVARIEQFAARYALSTAVEARHQVIFSPRHEAFVGEITESMNPALAKRIAHADLVILLGGTMDEPLLNAPVPLQTLIHIHPDIQALNDVYHADLAINATPDAFTQALLSVRLYNNWLDILQKDRADYAAWQVSHSDPGQWLNALSDALPDDVIVTHGMAAAVAAKAWHRTRPVLCVMDQHDFDASSDALLSAQHHHLGIVLMVGQTMTQDEFFSAWAAAVEQAALGTPVILHCLFTDHAKLSMHSLKEVMHALSQ